MQNDGLECYDEFEPRRMPKQASAFDARPFPMVPEVSLIMDKQSEEKKINDVFSSAIPGSGLSILGNSLYRANETYATWKEKQFSQQPLKVTPNRLHQIYSSTQNTSNSQDSHGFKETPNLFSSFDYQDHNNKNQNMRYEPPRKYSLPKGYGQSENVNKYTLSRAMSNNDIDYYNTNNLHNYFPNSCERDERIDSNSKREPDNTLRRHSYEAKQKSPRVIHRSSSYSSADSYPRRNIPVEHEYPPKHSRSLQPIHYNSENSHQYSACCASAHNNSSTETETIKNLLHVITSQNEQIKNLQKQVERLLKLHEQTLKGRNHCSCQSNGIVYQNTQLYDQSRTTNLPIAANNMIQEKERFKDLSDLKLQDEKTKQTILEQKVSIGVMTSFELKVQNNPSLTQENEKQKNHQEKALPTSNIIKNLVNDTGEMIRKKPNFFTPTPLENISEGSESHMSSLRQSHLCSNSTRQSVDAQDSTEVQNTNCYKQNFHEDDNIQINNTSFINHTNVSDDKNVIYSDKANYEIKESSHQKANKNLEQEYPYEQNHQYGNLHAFPYEVINSKKMEDFNAEPVLTDITKFKSTKCDNFPDECLSFSSSELDVDNLSPPSPEPSIHLDMQEYSSEGGSLPPQKKVGWTLYDNVLDQVNEILQNSPLRDSTDEELSDDMKRNEKKRYDKKRYEKNVIRDTVKAATLEQLTKLGISFSDNIEQRESNINKRVMFDTPYYQKQGPETHLSNGSIETNTSIHMKALAMKYLNDEQLADMTLQKSRPGVLKQVTSNVQNSNMSFATMHYLQRYHLLPGNNPNPIREVQREEYVCPAPVINERLAIKTVERREASPHRYQPFVGTSKFSYPSKILDISTLKQQPKLL